MGSPLRLLRSILWCHDRLAVPTLFPTLAVRVGPYFDGQRTNGGVLALGRCTGSSLKEVWRVRMRNTCYFCWIFRRDAALIVMMPFNLNSASWGIVSEATCYLMP